MCTYKWACFLCSTATNEALTDGRIGVFREKSLFVVDAYETGDFRQRRGVARIHRELKDDVSEAL